MSYDLNDLIKKLNENKRFCFDYLFKCLEFYFKENICDGIDSDILFKNCLFFNRIISPMYYKTQENIQKRFDLIMILYNDYITSEKIYKSRLHIIEVGQEIRSFANLTGYTHIEKIHCRL